MAASLFATVYPVMDANLDTVHSGAWFLCCALLGSHLHDANWLRAWSLVGAFNLAASFWRKQ